MAYTVRGASMSGLLDEGTQVQIVDRPIKRNDFIIFKMGNIVVVKRVIGIPGDTFDCKSNLKIQGQDTGFDPGILKLYWQDNPQISPQCFIVIGEHPTSRDSRHFGFVHQSDIVGPCEPVST